MTTLTEFLLARIAEDEAVARAARPHEYLPTRDGRNLTTIDAGDSARVGITSGRVLAECEAKRRIVNLDDLDGAGEDGHIHAVRCLASVYADHPDFREEWRP
jgi:hypothetical protein